MVGTLGGCGGRSGRIRPLDTLHKHSTSKNELETIKKEKKTSQHYKMISSTDQAAQALLTISGNVPRQMPRGILYRDPSVHPRWEDRFRSGEWALKHHIFFPTTKLAACFFQMKNAGGLSTLLYVGEVDEQLYPKGAGTLYKSSDRTEFLVDNSATEAQWKDFFQTHEGKTRALFDGNRRVYSYFSRDWDKFDISGDCEYSESKCTIHGRMVTEDGKYIFRATFTFVTNAKEQGDATGIRLKADCTTTTCLCEQADSTSTATVGLTVELSPTL